MTPSRAIAAGADYLVVGRPITEATDPLRAAEAIQAEIAQIAGLNRNRETGKCRRILDRSRRRSQRGRLQVLCGRQSSHLQEIQRALRRPSRQIHGHRRPKPFPQCRDRIPGLRDRAGLLSLPRIPGKHQGAAAAFERRSHHHRGLRRAAALISGTPLGCRRPPRPL